MNFVLPLILSLVFGCAVNSESEPSVTIPSLGQIRGSFLTSSGGRQFSSFRGVRYGKPPVGDLRFKDPVEAEPWSGVYDATKERPSCTQFSDFTKSVIGVEDCLILNIYTHNVNAVSGFKPVMVWIHGGGFMLGDGNGEFGLCGPNYIMDKDVVLVTINYRLNAFGFLTTGDAEAPGNYGLLDQSLALRWVRDHIRHFGGDPESVTLFGESAGGASVEYHILSPHSKGLFHRAIAQSGSTLCPWATQQTETEQYSKMLAEDLNCPLTSREMMSCLREKNATDIISFFQRKGQVLNMYPISMLGPRVDAERDQPFLPDVPETLIRTRKFNSVPYIAGLTKNEGAFIVGALLAHGGHTMKEFKTDPLKYIPYMLDFELHKGSREIAKKIIDQYFDSERDYDSQLTEIEQMNSDYLFNKWIDTSVHLFSKFSDQPVYYYNYGHKGQYSLDLFVAAPPGFNQGVGHGEELFVMFSTALLPKLSVPNDIKVSKMMVDLWTSFASDGVPKSSLITDSWLPLDPKSPSRYLKIEADEPRMINGQLPFHQRLPFWDSVFDVPVKDEL